MKKIAGIVIVIASALGLHSCADVPELNGSTIIDEGEPAFLRLGVIRDETVAVETKGMTTTDEKAIHDLYIIIFDSAGNKSTSISWRDMDEDLVFPVFSGVNMDIFAIANFDRGLTLLQSVTTKQQLLDLSLDGRSGSGAVFSGETVTNPGYLCYVGRVEDVNITSGTTRSAPQQVSLTLSPMGAKITVRIEDYTSNQSVSILSWKINNLPSISYLFGRETDAMTGESNYFNSNDMHSWERVETLASHTSTQQTFYMWENRKGTVSGSTSYKTKTQLAPANATNLVFFANIYNQANDSTYSMKYSLYLGADDSSDYNIERGHHYIWNINFNGINSVTVNVSEDKNVLQTQSFPIEIIASSVLTMDAHPSDRNFCVKADPSKISDLSVEVVDVYGRPYSDPGFEASWLKVSPLRLNRAQIKQSGNIFQQSGDVGDFVRPKYIPHKSFRRARATDCSWIENAGITLTSAGTGNGLNGNLALPDDDDCLPFPQATYRMCFKITDLPFSSSEWTNIMVYSDEYEYIDGESMRYGVVRFSFRDSSLHQNRSIDYRITQKQALYIGRVVDTYQHTTTEDETAEDIAARTTMKDVVIEQIEENSTKLYPDIPASYQFTTTMQWGFKGNRLFNPATVAPNDDFDKFRNGYFLTANAVYGDGSVTWTANGNVTKDEDGGNVSWSDGNAYRTKYGRTTTITEPYTGTTSGSPYYQATVIASTNYHPVYETSAARFCHDKNRDLNGDGELSPSETYWYLPSLQEVCQIWISLEAIRNTVTSEFGYGYYWSSSEYDSNKAYNFGFMSGYLNAGRDKDSNEGGDNHNDSVRCIRAK